MQTIHWHQFPRYISLSPSLPLSRSNASPIAPRRDVMRPQEWVTVEGEQVILSLQTARFLIKAVHEVGEVSGADAAETVRYLTADATPPSRKDRGLNTPEGIVQWLGARARTLAQRLTVQVDAEVASGVDFGAALNSRAVLAYRASEAHVMYVMLDNNLKAIEKYFGDKPAIQRVMVRLMELYGLQEIGENAGDCKSLSVFICV